MAFQNRPPSKPPDCPWCGETMIPCPMLAGRLCCPNDEPVEYRHRGGRWYFEGRLLGLDEPHPAKPTDEPEAALDPRDLFAEAERIAREKWGPGGDEDGEDGEG
jgi:hypothetical protein